MADISKAEAYVRTILAGNDGDVFSRNDLRQYIAEAWTAGYAEGVYDCSNKTSLLYPIPEPLSQLQAEILARQFKELNELAKDATIRDVLIDALLEELEDMSSDEPHQNLTRMITCCGDKLKQIKHKTNGRIGKDND